MHWKAFKEKASKINRKYFFKKTIEGYEVWDVAQVYGPGWPRKYRIMVIPYHTNSIGFSMLLKKLKQGEWNRRLANQLTLVQTSMRHNKELVDRKKEKAALMGVEIGKAMRRTFAKVADDLGVSERTIRMNMKNTAWDDTKKEFHRIMEARGAYK